MGSPCIAMIVEDEPAIRGLLTAMLSDLDCAVLASDSCADLAERIETFCPDIIFLDIGLRDGDASEVLATLARCHYRGKVQIVSGQSGTVMNDVRRQGLGLGLTMLKPIAKPFRLSSIEQVVADHRRRELRDSDDLLEGRAWLRPPEDAPGLVDLRRGTNDGALGQLQWWASVHSRLDTPIYPWTFCVPTRLEEIPHVLHMGPCRGHKTTLMLDEDDVCADLEAAHFWLSKIRERGFGIRLTGCGLRFFALAGHRPLPVDQADIGCFLRTGGGRGKLDKLSRLTEIAHRAGTILLSDEIGGGTGTDALARCGVDLWRSAEQIWSPVELRSADLPKLPRKPELNTGWRNIAVTEALAMRRTG